ncbi:MAG: NIPSNAP family protein [Algoriphagus sp.]
MKNLSLFLITFLIACLVQAQQTYSSSYFEMRTYTVYEGKMPDLIQRFQNHTRALFSKHGIENVAYFLSEEQPDKQLTFILGYPSAAERDIRWNNFANDPEWKAVAAASEANGKIVQKVDQVFMVLADGLNQRKQLASSGIFQLRTYYLFPGKLDAIQNRFRAHTQALFEKQGLVNYPYWITVEKDGTQAKLVYLIGHNTKEEFTVAFDRFRLDPAWIQVRDASEVEGKIVEKIDAVFFTPLPFSPMK